MCGADSEARNSLTHVFLTHVFLTHGCAVGQFDGITGLT